MSATPASDGLLVHGTAVALGDKAVLIRGPSGSGKTDLALRCIALPSLVSGAQRAELVADDQVRLVRIGDAIEASPPPTIAGKIEVRGVGIVTLPYRPAARLALIVDLVPAADVPRYPLDAATANYLGIETPVLRLTAFESSAPVKVILALDAAGAPPTRP